jgi:hypothetical protein
VFLLTEPAGANGPSFLSTLHHVNTLVSTVPGNGDLNPYGVAVVPVTMGALVANSVLVSNFNHSASLVHRPFGNWVCDFTLSHNAEGLLESVNHALEHTRNQAG